MIYYKRGLVVLGAAQPVLTTTSDSMSSERKRAMLDAATIVPASIGVGVVGGTIGGALLWTSHRVAGALLGGLLVGPTIGGLIGWVWAANKLKGLVK